jgi:hypothetical protein
MGRHSAAAGDDADEVTDAGLTLVTGDADDAQGRHARTEGVETPAPAPAEATAPIAPVEAPEPARKPVTKKESGTRADLRILREDRGVRWRCLAAVLVSFAVYTLVMLATGRMGSYAYWIWIPIVLSGVLVGTVLDWAHRRIRRVTSPR